ncbi:hypothetical protein MJO29_000630 [Puccinia striiformis f. sp. tritici]|uniref:Tyr recombinase domain-containing protein n=1 Tax=Puccinia striiformis f. sp. tritici PST-78 TaxID=1165861 RepID=A0A0L0URK5_9BASI|nr:hypothetical protein MJO29_000630 [Puccinia striiformis f. sp. tritici]KNE89389.1 hypothetical protein PSTG_17157 [Puccinia striiformis f. sp. tritici PST-78]
MLDLAKIKPFLQDGTNLKKTSSRDVHFLNGFKWNTLLSYNAAVKKYVKFAGSTGKDLFSLPLSPEEIYEFCYWAGRVLNEPTAHDVASSTLTKYLFGLQAWHLFHRRKYPDITKPTVTVLLRSSAHADAKLSAKTRKGAIHLKHLVLLAQTLAGGNQFHRALLDLAIVAFWGMARMSELTYDASTGQLRKTASVLTSDAVFIRGPKSIVSSLSIRGAKTCVPGGIQFLTFHPIPNMLCPVRALIRRIDDSKGKETSLFGYDDNEGNQVHLTKPVVCRTLSEIRTAHGFAGLSGHSFRVGGASFRNAMGTPIDRIRSLGRWTSDCYLLYLRQYTAPEIEETLKLWNELKICWKSS